MSHGQIMRSITAANRAPMSRPTPSLRDDRAGFAPAASGARPASLVDRLTPAEAMLPLVGLERSIAALMLVGSRNEREVSELMNLTPRRIDSLVRRAWRRMQRGARRRFADRIRRQQESGGLPSPAGRDGHAPGAAPVPARPSPRRNYFLHPERS